MSNWDPAADGANPYHSPTDDPKSGGGGDVEAGRISYKTVEMMRQTRPWAMFVGVVIIVLGVLSAAMGVIGLAMMSDNPQQVELGIIAGVRLVSGLIYVGVGSCAIRYAARTAAFLAARSVDTLDNALESQRTFWRTVGTIAAVMVGLMVLLLVLGLAGNLAQQM